jgi:hypothetical protein
MVTLMLMGGATFAIGLVPKYETIGFAPLMLTCFEAFFTGLALGGECRRPRMCEHSPIEESVVFFWTSWIRIAITAGLFISLVILVTKNSMEKTSWEDWGWQFLF